MHARGANHASGSKSPQSSFEIFLLCHDGAAGFDGASIAPIEGGAANSGGDAIESGGGEVAGVMML